jgi:hypothetical protein
VVLITRAKSILFNLTLVEFPAAVRIVSKQGEIASIVPIVMRASIGWSCEEII